VREFEPLGGVQGHQVDAVAALFLVLTFEDVQQRQVGDHLAEAV
jgi:hypothetical protein